MLSDKILGFLFNLQFEVELPGNVEVMNPFTNEVTKEKVREFYHRFYSDENSRYCIIGINPGRFGGGVTGIPFTDPIRLEKDCGIKNDWQKKPELSSVFIYEMIRQFGGPSSFYSKFYFTAVSPLGFTSAGKNLNYYDDKSLAKSIQPFAVKCLQQQLLWGLHSDVAFCLGEGKNYQYLQHLNAQHKFFEEIIPLPHPRFIMQYKLKTKQDYITKYIDAFNKI